jgi:hypothetical protein
LEPGWRCKLLLLLFALSFRDSLAPRQFEALDFFNNVLGLLRILPLVIPVNSRAVWPFVWPCCSFC